MLGKMCDHSNGWRPEDGVPDLAMMSDITAEGINVNLRTRYMRDQIYTFSGSILIAVNPYKRINIYNGEWIARYRQQKLGQTDPHVFALTEAMYMNLVMQDRQVIARKKLPSSAQGSNARADSQSAQQQTPDSVTGFKNQACVISGESGAGKTETTKFILSYLCSVTPNKSVWMEHQILEANTILEAFGNAKTVRNDNSSRFGKFIQICFDSRHQINGCIIQDYLLEQSRITYQSSGERNYHVFYQLLAAGQANEDLRKKFHLMPASFFEYLNKTNCYSIDGSNDCAMFDSLRTAMSVLNMEQESCDGLFSVLSAILWLGNMQFKCDDDAYGQGEQSLLTDSDRDILETVSDLLGVQKLKLLAIMLKRQINVRGSITEIPFKIHEARDNRNGMAKALYSKLFTWVVNFINASTNPGLDNTCFLGILDIFGFENFESNSFEQLCINYANEKLHKFFNQHMFAMEQELYKREGIDFCDINYTDNTPCLELLERPPNCILRLLSEECRMPKGSDATFVEKLHNEFTLASPNPFYLKGNDRRNWSSEFSVRHFAGIVTYNVNGFLKKNKDSQQAQLIDIIDSSTNSFLFDIFNGNLRDYLPSSGSSSIDQQPTEAKSACHRQQASANVNFRPRLHSQQSFCIPPTEALCLSMRRESSFNFESSRQASSLSNGSTKSKPTVADSFRHQLASLVDLLSNVNPWYVRCIKPNLEKSATDYDDRQVLMQLKYLGMSDLIRIRREGYPIHFTKHQFVCRYRCLMLKHQRLTSSSPIKLDDASLDTYCHRMMAHFCLDKRQWRIGKTMVLLRLNSYQPLEEKRNQLFTDMAVAIQSYWRRFLQRRQYVKVRLSAIKIQEAFRAYRGRLQYLRKKRATLTIQAYCRGMFAREIASALREIKRAEREKAAELARLEEEEREIVRREEEITIAREAAEAGCRSSPKAEVEIVVDGATDWGGTEATEQSQIAIDLKVSSPLSSVSPAASPCANSLVGSGDINGVLEADQKQTNHRDKKEMEELVKVLERHGIALDAINHSGAQACADFERLYDILGQQTLTVNSDTQSLSPSINEDDRCSYMTNGTTCDGDSVSCSGQSQISSTITDEQTYNDEAKPESDNFEVHTDQHTNGPAKDATANNNLNEHYHSNSIESIASIASSNSLTLNQPLSANQTSSREVQPLQSVEENRLQKSCASELAQPTRTSTFTGNPVVTLSGSKSVTSSGRPLLARIEEEPNSVASSPSKTPKKQLLQRPHSLFPPRDEDQENALTNQHQANDLKRRRVERRILQVQQEQAKLPPINPTTAGLPSASRSTPTVSSKPSSTTTERGSALRQSQQVTPTQDDCRLSDNDLDSIYGSQKSDILAYAELTFNNHARDSSSSVGNGMMRTLTRRRKSVESNCSEFLTKSEMLSYNSSFSIPTSHIKMHDPHAAQISCSIFKNLCKYMTGESAKNDTEVRIIQSIVRNGIEKVVLRDEIYIQIIRQLTNNPQNENCTRLWTLLGLVSAAFPPSKNFLKHLIAYLRSKPRKDPSITIYAQFCLDNLQAPRLSTRKHPPSLLEIQACKSLTTLNCRIHLLDGRCETVSVHPCDTTIDVLTKLAHQINLQSIEGWALYESYTPGASKYPHPAYEQRGDFERAVKPLFYMADLIASWHDGLPKSTNISLKVAQKRIAEGNFKLTLKKRIFHGPKIRNDQVEISLLYAQAVHNVVRKDSFFVDENLALGLAGLQAQVYLGNATSIFNWPQDTQISRRGKVLKQATKTQKSPSQVYDMENYICVRLRNQATRSKKDWCNLIHQTHKQAHNVNEFLCKMRYLSMVICHCPLYGTATFEVTYKGYQSLDQNLMLGVNAEGLVLIRSSDKALLNAYRYSDVCHERGLTVYIEENIIQINVKDSSDGSTKCLSFESNENEEIASLMRSYSHECCNSPLTIYLRGQTTTANSAILETNADHNLLAKKRSKLKMTLEDRMRTIQEVQNSRKAIVKSGKLRKPTRDENQTSLLKNTLRRLSTNKTSLSERSTRFENIYGTLGRFGNNFQKSSGDMPQTSSDYNLYSSISSGQVIPEDEGDHSQQRTEVAGTTAATNLDENMKAYPHAYWAYTKYPIRNSLLTIYDSDLEEAALTNFAAILTYSGLLNQSANEIGSGTSTLDSSSIDSGIASQQSLANGVKFSGGSPSSVSSNDIYDVCPKKMDEKELINLVQGILDRCLKEGADILRNELFLQLIKQTTDHPDQNSEINKRHWQLLTLACSVTYPNDKILSYLFAHLRRCSLDQITDEGRYAQFTLKCLQGTLDTKGRRCAPSEMEIQSTINCRRVYARVHFLDGQFQAVEFDPCATIAEVVEQIKHKIGLRADCTGYALFQPLDDDCEQVLRPEDKVGDALAEWEVWQRKVRQTRGGESARANQKSTSSAQAHQPANNASNIISKASLASLNSSIAKSNKAHRFIFKKYLFLDSNLNDLNDTVERELIYHQTVASIKEDKFPILEQEATILCALKAQIEIGDHNKLASLAKEHVRIVYKQVIMSLMPPHAFNNLPAQAIAQQHQAFRELDCADAKKYFFNLIQSFGRANFANSSGHILLHRAHVYEATQTFATVWPSDVWIVINQIGLHMLITRSREILASCEYRQIVHCNSNNNYLMIILLTNNSSRIKYTFYTKHAQQIAQQMKDYIEANSLCGNKRRKTVEFNLKQ